jgi:membrane-bound ClpP family serine protease
MELQQKLETEQLKSREKAALNRRFEIAAWTLLLMMLGGLAIVPNELVPEGFWALGAWLIMLGLNAARYFWNLSMSGLTLLLGSLALLAGLASLLGFNLPLTAVLIILSAVHLLIQPRLERNGAAT